MATTTLHNNAQQNGHQHSARPIQPATTAPLPQRDEFDSAAFEAQRESLPYLQLLNCQDPDQLEQVWLPSPHSTNSHG